MDQFGFEQLAAWLTHRVSLPPGPLFCVIDGPTRGRRWAAIAARAELRQLVADAGVRRRFAPHQLGHAHAVELARERVAINIIQRQLGHTDLGTTSTYLQGIDPSEIIDAVRSRRQPTISATAGLTSNPGRRISGRAGGRPRRITQNDYRSPCSQPACGSVAAAARLATERKSRSLRDW